MRMVLRDAIKDLYRHVAHGYLKSGSYILIVTL